jgi:hypothetical protein
MDVGMRWPLSPPGRQDTRKARQSRTDEARGLGEAFARLCRGRAQGWVGQPGMGATKGAQRFWHSAGDQEGRSGPLCIELGVQSLHGLMLLPRWTVPIATGMSAGVRLLTTLAGREARAVGARAATADGVNRLVVRGREVGRARDIL